MIEIRETPPQDADEVRVIEEHANRFLRRVYRPTLAGHANRTRLSRDLTRIVACWGDKIVGTTQYYVEGGIMRLLGVAVHEDYRCQGIGRALVDRAVEWAREEGVSAVRVSTIKETGNVPIFERLGFQVIGENADDLCEGVNGEKVTDVEMEKRLTTGSP